MNITGTMLLGATERAGTDASVNAINPVTGETLSPAYPGGTKTDVDEAATMAWGAFDGFRTAAPEKRAQFLETIATEILNLGDALIERAMLESGLPQARLEGERGRTVGQLRLFAQVLRNGDWLGVRVDPAMPDRSPMPRGDLRRQQIALGPVAVFGASNFPLAFSVAGGDTASALAAGCPVIVKAHPAHPGTSEMVGRAVQEAVRQCELPEGVFSLLYGTGYELGGALVAHPKIKAVGFTGSRRGGLALMEIANKRPEPIPVYTEMSSINPVFLMPEALKNRGEAIAKSLIVSLNMGAGQFCTNPGLVLAMDGPGLGDFLRVAVEEVENSQGQTMLTPEIYQAYCQSVDTLGKHKAVTQLASGKVSSEPNLCQPGLYSTTASEFLANSELGEEVFGASSLIVVCQDHAEFAKVAEAMEGQLTATLQLDDEDVVAARPLVTVLERKVGRILCNGYPTGVEVCHAMVHGGPFPATSDGRSTSVGSAAIDRFLRPVCYQDMPAGLLPVALQDNNPLAVPRMIEGKFE